MLSSYMPLDLPRETADTPRPAVPKQNPASNPAGLTLLKDVSLYMSPATRPEVASCIFITAQMNEAGRRPSSANLTSRRWGWRCRAEDASERPHIPLLINCISEKVKGRLKSARADQYFCHRCLSRLSRAPDLQGLVAPA
jgi:hypothetical protein